MNVRHGFARYLCLLCACMCLAAPLTSSAAKTARTGTIATDVYTADGLFLGSAPTPATFSLVDNQASSPVRAIPAGSTLTLYVPTAFAFAGKTYRASTRGDVTMSNQLHAGRDGITLWSGVNQRGTECTVDVTEAENVYHVTWPALTQYGTDDPYSLIFELAQLGTLNITGEQMRIRVTLAITTEDLLNAIQAIDERLAAQEAAEQEAAEDAAGSLPNAGALIEAGQLAGNDEDAFEEAFIAMAAVTGAITGAEVSSSVQWWEAEETGHFYLWFIGASVVSVVMAGLFHIKKEIGSDN